MRRWWEGGPVSFLGFGQNPRGSTRLTGRGCARPPSLEAPLAARSEVELRGRCACGWMGLTCPGFFQGTLAKDLQPPVSPGLLHFAQWARVLMREFGYSRAQAAGTVFNTAWIGSLVLSWTPGTPRQVAGQEYLGGTRWQWPSGHRRGPFSSRDPYQYEAPLVLQTWTVASWRCPRRLSAHHHLKPLLFDDYDYEYRRRER